jgi:hypothetical protein
VAISLNARDKKVLDEIQELREHPEKVQERLQDPEQAQRLGNVAQLAQGFLIDSGIIGFHPVVKEAVRRKAEVLQAELAGQNPTPLERLLAERIVSCWLHLHHLEMHYGMHKEMSLALGTYYQHCIDRAHRRYLSAIKVLAVVRRLTLPAPHVNVASKQGNAAGGNGDTAPPESAEGRVAANGNGNGPTGTPPRPTGSRVIVPNGDRFAEAHRRTERPSKGPKPSRVGEARP